MKKIYKAWLRFLDNRKKQQAYKYLSQPQQEQKPRSAISLKTGGLLH
jgi:hypothetical protein